MDLVKAVGKGKPFRRAGATHWIDGAFKEVKLSKADILAGDWEVLRDKRLLDADAVKAALKKYGATNVQAEQDIKDAEAT